MTNKRKHYLERKIRLEFIQFEAKCKKFIKCS